jgi:hypothetical protein
MSVVLLQAAVGNSVADSVIEISPRQNESLGHPPVVRIERRAGVKPSKAGVLKLLVEVVENADLTDDECRLSFATLKVVGVPAKDCVRLTHLECLHNVATSERSAQQPAENRALSGQKRDETIEAMQAELIKLAHERDWYMQQAETFRSQMAVASEELDLASVSQNKLHASAHSTQYDLLFLLAIFIPISFLSVLLSGGESGGGFNVCQKPFSRTGNSAFKAQGNELAWRGYPCLILHKSILYLSINEVFQSRKN